MEDSTCTMKEYKVEDDAIPSIAVAKASCPDVFGDIGGEGLLKSIKTTPLVDLELKNLPTLPNNVSIVSVRKAQGADPQPTNQDGTYTYTYAGLPHPVDYAKVKTLKDISAHHSSCIQAKLSSSIGLGFVSEGKKVQAQVIDPEAPPEEVGSKIQSLLSGESYIESEVDKKLDPLTLHGFRHELERWVEDFLDCGCGYLEVVRDNGGQITGLNWLPVEDLYVYTVQDSKTNRSWMMYRYVGNTYTYSMDRYFALFGKQNRKLVQDMFYSGAPEAAAKVSEIIPLYQASNRSRFYGYPQWLSAAPMIDLLRRAVQYKSDWFTNRGVLDYIFTVAGNVDKNSWNSIVSLIQGSAGQGNNFKALALKIATEAKAEVHHMAGNNSKEDTFSKDLDTFAQFIVSAHRVPPILANILIPGKLGASNEMIQALVNFQLLVANPIQNNIQKTLARTLAGSEGIRGLDAESFRLIPITSQFDITGMDAISRSRSEAIDNSPGPDKDRDYGEGVKD